MRNWRPSGKNLIAVVVAIAAVAIVSIALLRMQNSGSETAKRPQTTNTALLGPSQNKIDPGREGAPATLLAKDIQGEWREIDDPTQDGWDTEAFTLRAEKQLKRIGKLLTSGQAPGPDALLNLVDDRFECSRLLPENLQSVFSGPSINVQRMQQAPTSATDAPQHAGREALRSAVAELAKPFQDAHDLRAKIKTVMVRVEDDEIATRHLLELSGRLEDGTLEHHATWDARWTNPAQEAPMLTSLDTVSFEQVRVQAPHGTLLVDCTRSALEQNPCYQEQFLHGYETWLSNMPHTRYFVSLGNPGLAVGDVNGDGMDDLYVCQEQGLPNRLFIQQEDGTLDDLSVASEVDWVQDSRSALFVDLDNDGDQDLVVAFIGGLLIAANDGKGKFAVQTMLPTSEDLMSISAADFDNDGDVDIYSTAYFPDHFIEHSHAGGLPTGVTNFVYHDSNLGGRNILFRNDVENDDWNFLDVTKKTGLENNNSRFSFIGSWDDYDNDGDQDLYVANDYGRDNLYRNDGGHFVDVAEQAGAEDAASGMSVSWGDYDRDGWMDVYVSNMWSSAGKRISNQPQFKKNAPPDVKQRLRRFARGNTLLHNDGKGHFDDQSKDAGVEMGRWSWGSLFADINNDGWEDLLIGNGYITGDDTTGDL